MKDLLSG